MRRDGNPVFGVAVVCAGIVGVVVLLAAGGPTGEGSTAVDWIVKAAAGMAVFLFLFTIVLFANLAFQNQWPKRLSLKRVGDIDLPDPAQERAEPEDEKVTDFEESCVDAEVAALDAQADEPQKASDADA
jgi:hypothetical protein